MVKKGSKIREIFVASGSHDEFNLSTAEISGLEATFGVFFPTRVSQGKPSSFLSLSVLN